ncbi:MAG TPA: hypothetical protein PKC76_06460 [Saprospiraceae bacterium]|nr:hypothetical protein [Saprospiraceae bacterium]HMP23753.1 hypothetical protein [Saprospiraceae bacterium]
MPFVSQDIIDAIVERFDNAEVAYEQAIEQFEQTQPILLSYLFSEEFEVFTSDEREFTLMLAVIIFTAVAEVREPLPQIDETAIANAEEQNWAKLEGVSARHFNERIDVFFQDYPQEELLAFVEDALADDDEDPIVTKEAREAIFITLKTVIDCLTAA